jgi:hypothetical protein
MENNLSPNYLSEKLIRRNQLTQYSMRSGNTFNVPSFKSNATQNSLFFKGTQFYNEFKKKHQNCLNLESFLQEVNLYVRNH